MNFRPSHTSPEQQEKALTLADFQESIYRFRLTFKSPSMESEYHEKRIDPLAMMRPFSIVFIILACIIGLRRIEALILISLGVPTIASTAHAETVNVIFLGATCILEAMIVLIRRLWIVRGLFFMLFIFFSISYGNYAATEHILVLYYFFECYKKN